MNYADLSKHLNEIKDHIDPIITKKLGEELVPPMSDIYTYLFWSMRHADEAARTQQETDKQNEHTKAVELLAEALKSLSTSLKDCIQRKQPYNPDWYAGVREKLLAMQGVIKKFNNTPDKIVTRDYSTAPSPLDSSTDSSRSSATPVLGRPRPSFS